MEADVKWTFKDGSSLLHFAALLNKTEVMKSLIDQGADIGLFDNVVGGTPLLWAVANGKEDAALYLIERGADIDAHRDTTPLSHAAFGGHLAVVNLLLEAHAAIEMECVEGNRALHASVIGGQLETTQRLIEAGAKVDVMENAYGMTPLYMAAEAGFLTLVELLLQHGADCHHRLYDRDGFYSGKTILHAAALCGQIEMVQLILQKGVQATIPDHYGNTVLHRAAMNGHELMVKKFLTLINVDAQAENGETPLFHAVEEGQLPVVELLLTARANVNICADGKVSLLHQAASMGNLPILSLLLDAGAEKEAMTDDGATPLHTAICKNQVTAVKRLLEAGSDPNTLLVGITPLSLVCGLRYNRMVGLVIDGGADVNLKSENMDRTTCALHVSIAMEDDESMILLLQANADPNQPTGFGVTPVQMAAQRFLVKTVESLVAFGANLHTTDFYGHSPLFWIRQADEHAADKLLPPNSHSELDWEERENCLKTTIAQMVTSLRTTEAEATETRFEPLYIGSCLAFLGHYDNAVTAYEMRIRIEEDLITYDYICDNCERTLKGSPLPQDPLLGPLYICTGCPNMCLCGDCYATYDCGLPLWPSCREHYFLKVPGDSFSSRPFEVINARGESLEQWLDSLWQFYELGDLTPKNQPVSHGVDISL